MPTYNHLTMLLPNIQLQGLQIGVFKCSLQNATTLDCLINQQIMIKIN
jgi:hypothetical protein